MNIGHRITLRLKELEWERKDLLSRVPDLTPQALSNLIKRDSVRSEWDEAIADALGVSVLWLVYNKNDNDEQNQIHLSKLETQIVDGYRASDETARETMMFLAERALKAKRPAAKAAVETADFAPPARVATNPDIPALKEK